MIGSRHAIVKGRDSVKYSNRKTSKSVSDRSDKSMNSNDSSRSRSRDKKNKKKDKKSERKDQKTYTKKRLQVNRFALANLIVDQKRSNQTLDKNELARATIKLATVDSSGRQATLMSEHINKETIYRKEEERRTYDHYRQYQHKQQQSQDDYNFQLNNQTAQQFIRSLKNK